MIIVTGCLVATVAAGTALAQPAVSPVPAPQTAKPLDRSDLRYQIYVMEGALMRAVAAGAQRLNREIRSVAPEMVALSGEPQARGVYLEGYGVFFDVGVPILHQSMVWSLRTLIGQDGAAEALNVLRQQPKPADPNQRLAVENAIARLELMVGTTQEPAQSLFQPRQPVPAPGGAPGPVPTASAASVVAAPAPPSTADAAAKAFSLDKRSLQDPNAVNRAYTESVKRALVDAMIEYSLPMAIGPDEFLTVGARDNMQRDSLAPFDPYEEVVTILLRIKGSDLAEYRAGRIDRDEVRRRVQLREF